MCLFPEAPVTDGSWMAGLGESATLEKRRRTLDLRESFAGRHVYSWPAAYTAMTGSGIITGQEQFLKPVGYSAEE